MTVNFAWGLFVPYHKQTSTHRTHKELVSHFRKYAYSFYSKELHKKNDKNEWHQPSHLTDWENEIISKNVKLSF